MPDSKRKRRSTRQIRKILDELTESGLSQREFARHHDIPLSTITNWLRKHRQVGATALAQQEVIPVGTISEPPVPLEIEFPGGEVLRIGSDCSMQSLRRVLAELRRC